jgi:hypothetical protein
MSSRSLPPSPLPGAPARLLRWTFFLLSVLAWCGCSARHGVPQEGEPALPQDCEDFVAAYQRYLGAASPGAGAIAEGRARETRTALLNAVRVSKAEDLTKKCRENLRSIPGAEVSGPR